MHDSDLKATMVRDQRKQKEISKKMYCLRCKTCIRIAMRSCTIASTMNVPWYCAHEHPSQLVSSLLNCHRCLHAQRRRRRTSRVTPSPSERGLRVVSINPPWNCRSSSQAECAPATRSSFQPRRFYAFDIFARPVIVQMYNHEHVVRYIGGYY